MVALWKEHVDTFTWSCQDMPGSDTDVVVPRAIMERRLSSKEAERQCLYQRAMQSPKTEEGHLADRGKSFDRLRQFKLRLNSSECTIRVRSGCSPTETVCAGSYHFVDFKMDLIKYISEKPALTGQVAKEQKNVD
ncbi:hypothetical protein KIW84_073733 [Lathyrus oleraceus]|uniref:Uncharacterized protein n=1 Tax=Pisum sativum TaxID=3888 RepID=A0A9D4VQA9_PEA|nr:hypothetical protein KIW84_073733 [Pisum sativum]